MLEADDTPTEEIDEGSTTGVPEGADAEPDPGQHTERWKLEGTSTYQRRPSSRQPRTRSRPEGRPELQLVSLFRARASRDIRQLSTMQFRYAVVNVTVRQRPAASVGATPGASEPASEI